MYENHSKTLLPRKLYYKRILRHFLIASLIVLISLGVGILGYHIFEGLNFIDSLLNASMILGGMGPVNEVKTDAGKIFASFYALFSGIVFLVIAGVIFAPIFHRFLHKFHLNLEDKGNK
jgi:uncharacterized protein involved in cysteine biosynthesis